eukprot:11940-Heterococcus_DN1.PRE.2
MQCRRNRVHRLSSVPTAASFFCIRSSINQSTHQPQRGTMKAFTGHICCIAALAGVAALYLDRKAGLGEHALSCEGSAASSTETGASNNVMNNPYLVQSILDFVGPGQHLYISTISKLVRQCYDTCAPVL